MELAPGTPDRFHRLRWRLWQARLARGLSRPVLANLASDAEVTGLTCDLIEPHYIRWLETQCLRMPDGQRLQAICRAMQIDWEPVRREALAAGGFEKVSRA